MMSHHCMTSQCHHNHTKYVELFNKASWHLATQRQLIYQLNAFPDFYQVAGSTTVRARTNFKRGSSSLKPLSWIHSDKAHIRDFSPLRWDPTYQSTIAPSQTHAENRSFLFNNGCWAYAPESTRVYNLPFFCRFH